MQVGDILTHVDGLPITSERAARRFVEASPGDEVRLTLRRDGETIEIALRAP
jgi:S1-C subfamily serine protease